jgi:hypothetical protein
MMVSSESLLRPVTVTTSSETTGMQTERFSEQTVLNGHSKRRSDKTYKDDEDIEKAKGCSWANCDEECGTGVNKG